MTADDQGDDQGRAVPDEGAASPRYPVDSVTRRCCGGIGRHTRDCAAVPRLQDVLGEHQPYGLEPGWADKVAAAWREACTIRTVEQLDALPFLSLVREVVFRPAPVSGVDYGGVWERRTSGWEALSGSVMPPGYTSPRLPALLIWHPDWSEQ